MPEYLAPGVFVEEVSFRAKSIEGVSTTTTGFIGPARSGPVQLEPDIVTSLGEFEELYGDGDELVFEQDQRMPNFLWHAVRAFFTEGGKRLYVSRVYQPGAGGGRPQLFEPLDPDEELGVAAPQGTGDERRYPDGYARAADLVGRGLVIRARHPGAMGNGHVRFTLKAGDNILGMRRDPASGGQRRSIGALADRDLVWVRSDLSGARGHFYIAQRNGNTAAWTFLPVAGAAPGAGTTAQTLDELFPIYSPPVSPETFRHVSPPRPPVEVAMRVVTLTVTLLSRDGTEFIRAWSDLPLDPGHRRGPIGDSIFHRFPTTPASAGDARRLPLVIARNDNGPDGGALLLLLFGANVLRDVQPTPAEEERGMRTEDKLKTGVHASWQLVGGHDGARPGAADYEGEANPARPYTLGLKQFEAIEDISIVAAPGHTFGWNDGYAQDAQAIAGLLIAHAESMRYRIAVLDSADRHTISEVRDMRGAIDSKHAALYYPWVRVLDPITRNEIDLPPSGFVAGIYARNDIERGVYKAPANEVVRLALGFEMLLNKAQQEVLNPSGINCFRFFEGRGMRLWGARTISSDPEWKYVNVRRYFAYLERSIDKGTQWAVFEPNGDQLWANIRRTVEDFLLNEWQNGALLGDKPEKAYFVRCDRSTMTQNDLDNGRLVCLIGVAPLKPAEFVIFRIGQWTADRKV